MPFFQLERPSAAEKGLQALSGTGSANAVIGAAGELFVAAFWPTGKKPVEMPELLSLSEQIWVGLCVAQNQLFDHMPIELSEGAAQNTFQGGQLGREQEKPLRCSHGHGR